MLIDSGSTRSFLDPDVAFKLFPYSIQNDPFIVSTVFQKSSHEYSALMPTAKIFNLPTQTNLKFYLFRFHNDFDGLLGLDNLKLLKITLQFEKGMLITPYAKIPLKYHKISNSANLITVHPRVEQIIRVKTNIKNGEIIIPHKIINNCEIPECVTISKDGYALTSILNTTNSPQNVDFSKPLEVENFCQKTLEESSLNNYMHYQKKKFNPSTIRTNHLNEEEKTEILKLCKEYSDIFYDENDPLTFTNEIKHNIKTSDELPIYSKSYRYPFIHKTEVNRQIETMLRQNIIRPSNSPWSSPIWVVPKKVDATQKQKWRIVVDYRKLNEKTIGDKYPLPNISDILDKLGKCQYFTTLDLANGFHQIEINEIDIPKTAFNTESGHWEFLRMPFGLKNAPATFQRVMDNILRGIQHEKCLVYMDDIIVYSTSLQEHLNSLKCVFQRLRNANLKIQPDKSEFLRKEVAYLGHIITPDGVKPNPEKIKAIKQYPLPKNTKQIKGFLGLLGYYRKFINNFAQITKPLTKCLKKGAVIEHNNEFLTCFETCKNLLINDPILQYPDFVKSFNLTTDASNVALGAVLSQGPIGKDLPIAFASRTLNDTEQNYSVIEKELLAIVWATKYFRPYLYGRQFTIVCDHKPLQWLFNLKDPSSKLLRWRIKLDEYDYKIIYKTGNMNTNADALSRIELHAKNIQESNEDYSHSDSSSMQVEPDLDPQIIENIDKDYDDNTVHSNAEQDPIVEIPITDVPLNHGQNQIVVSSVFHSPSKPKLTILFGKKRRLFVQISKNDLELDITNLIREYITPNIQYYIYFEDHELYEPFCEVVRKNFKWPSFKFKRCLTKLADVTNEEEIAEIVKNYHEGKTNHRGIEETQNKVKKRYYWPHLTTSVQTYINECEICQQSKYERNPLKITMNVTPTAVKPFEIVHLDTFTVENSKFLTLIDSFSKYAQAYKLISLSSTEIVNNLLNFFSHHGVPKQVIVDNGTEFKNSVVKELLNLHKINLHFCSPNHPQSNGMIERLHSTLIEHIRLLNTRGFQKTPIDMKMIYAILAYNYSIHSTTKIKPIDIITGHITNENPFDINIDEILINDYINDHKQRTMLMYSKINECLGSRKESTINKLNKNRDQPTLFRPHQRIFVKKHIRQKTANKFGKSKEITDINYQQKTISTEDQSKVHMDNLKRPRQR